MTQYHPAPWTLEGYGYVFLYKFPKSMAGARHFTAPGASGNRFSGLGTVIIADYSKSAAGPYGELLVIPGRFPFGNERAHSIAKIYVSSEASVINGRRNWGIPKELADFRFEPAGEGRRRVTVTKGPSVIFFTDIETFGPRFPVSNALFPMPLAQKLDGNLFRTAFSGRGRARLARIREMSAAPAFFPDISSVRPLAAIGLDDFRIVFPEARIEGMRN